ncbi:rho GDP-dissociation inhibitor 1 [Lingula anatina]|uniref:Rho GDP-dissociation inhibitor 3 n=1 Tax=Lingula anatina TaxID=7574 RepID=A0A1S3JYX4_LINAN|nr:rho GDP-dissociation inhibitor 1 [Lingula anatina]|eukprot:XP_013415615.1 rho GDP-dissociation inhibitor 1 [Lingula anatina]
MAEQGDDLTPDETPGYKPPAEKKLAEMVNLDTEDESLRKYKEQLLGTAAIGAENTAPFPEDPRNVIITKMALLVDGRPDVELDLTGDLSKKFDKITMKEGCKYKIKIYFYVQREIVPGLKFVLKTSRKGISVDKESHMVGSYGPRKEIHTYTTPPEDCPSGMIARGNYSVKSLFTDDDKNEILRWEWHFEIKKDWD